MASLLKQKNRLPDSWEPITKSLDFFFMLVKDHKMHIIFSLINLEIHFHLFYLRVTSILQFSVLISL